MPFDRTYVAMVSLYCAVDVSKWQKVKRDKKKNKTCLIEVSGSNGIIYFLEDVHCYKNNFKSDP